LEVWLEQMDSAAADEDAADDAGDLGARHEGDGALTDSEPRPRTEQGLGGRAHAARESGTCALVED